MVEHHVTEKTFDKLPAIVALKKHYDEVTSKTPLKDLLQDEERNRRLTVKFDKMMLDYTHTKIDSKGLDLLVKVARSAELDEKIADMFSGEKINTTEGRKVLHTKLRQDISKEKWLDEDDLAVREVQERIKQFSTDVRNEKHIGYTGKKLRNIVSIGIGGSSLGPEAIFEALRTDTWCAHASKGMQLKFLSNVDPVDFKRCVDDSMDIEETLFIVVSKTFTTAETMMNARVCR